MNLEEMERQLEKIPLDFLQQRVQEVEWESSVPMFVTALNNYVTLMDKIPTMRQFFDSYIASNRDHPTIRRFSHSQELMGGLRARAYRAYPSLVRDIHFEKLLSERFTMLYDEDIDIKAGIDYVINYKGNTFYVHCQVDTPASRNAREKKNSRHDYRGFHVDLFLKREKSRKLGDFWLYAERDINRLKQAMDELVGPKSLNLDSWMFSK